MPTDSPSDVRPRPEPCPFCGEAPTIQRLGGALPMVACQTRSCAAYCKTMLLSRWNRRVASLPRVGPSPAPKWSFEDVRRELQAELANVDKNAREKRCDDDSRIELIAFSAYLFFKARSHPTGLREQVEALRKMPVEPDPREEVVRWDNRDDIYNEAWCSGHDSALAAVLRILDGGTEHSDRCDMNRIPDADVCTCGADPSKARQP